MNKQHPKNNQLSHATSVCPRWATMINRVGLTLLCLGWASAVHAQQPERVLAPGVLRTIAPQIEEGETVSDRADLIEISKARSYLKWQPRFSPSTRTLFERSLSVPLRRSIWGLEFTFKPFRMIEVDIPQVSGKMQRKTLWYMVYRVRYLGEELHFEQQREAFNDGANRYVRFRNTKKDAEYRYFLPYFTLRSHTFAKEYLDRLIPSAVDDIAAVEKVGAPLLNSIEIANTRLPKEDAETGKGVWGVVIWEDVDPRTNFFSLYIQGLTNAYKYRDTAENITKRNPIAQGRELEVKTLQLNYYRPGDTIDLVQDHVYYGLPNALPRPEIVYSLEQGDTLQSLAKRFLGDKTRFLEIYQFNRDILSSPDKLPVGKMVRFPRNNHEHYNDLQPVRLYRAKAGETLQSIGQNLDIQLSALREVNFDKLGFDGEPSAGDYVLLPITLNRLNRPEPVGSDIYKIYTRRQVQIMRLYGMADFARNQWIYASPTPPVFRSAE